MKYKVGDKVKIRTWEELERDYEVFPSGSIHSHSPSRAFFTREMERELSAGFPDRILTIMEVRGYYYLTKEMDKWAWCDYMIEGLARYHYTIFDSIDYRFELMDFE